MADTAAHLVDRVLPDVPIRQWVLSLPVAMRYRLAYDAKLTREVLHVFVQSLFASLRRRAKQRYGIRNAECGCGPIPVNSRFQTDLTKASCWLSKKKCVEFALFSVKSQLEIAEPICQQAT